MFKKLFNPGIISNYSDLTLLLMRIGVGALMLSHGAGKFLKLFGDEPVKFSDPLGVGATASLAMAVFAEVFCSIFLIFGFATRLSVVPLIITMLVAVLLIHTHDPFPKKELPLLYIIIYLAIGIFGAGKYSVDNLIYKKLSLRKSA
ncbi:MAG TPA: DoxX family protein [Ignavibacteria bacterium]|nr:DoxX family protein [Ignavibacteria bacterium]